MSETIEINGETYVKKGEVLSGNRAVIVVDRGWIFAGDVEDRDDRIHLSRAVWLFRWEKVGFSKVLENQANADIRPIADVDIPAGAEIFRIPVKDDWGL